MVHVLCRIIKEFNEEEAATNNGESDDDVARCLEDLVTKVYDLKSTNAGGNKIRGTMMPPIFSMGCSRSF